MSKDGENRKGRELERGGYYKGDEEWNSHRDSESCVQKNALILERKDGDLHGYYNVILFPERNWLQAERTVNDEAN